MKMLDDTKIKTLRTFVAICLVGFSTAVLPGAFAAPESTSSGLVAPPGILALIVNDDTFSTTDLTALVAASGPGPNPTKHYGPYASDSPDSGTCGNDWANDMFDRHFTVFKNPDGTFVVVQQFKQGTFETDAGPSPGACEPGNTPGSVSAGITGKMHGYFIIPLPLGTIQTSTDSRCNAGVGNSPCTTTTFIDTHFTPCYAVSTCPVTTFFFHYAAGDQGLIMHEWKNASTDRGGNSGDIRSTTP
jgi:hypothetical protein